MLSRLRLVSPAELTTPAGARADLWHIRKGLYATVAGARPSGTTALLEDIAVPVPSLAGTCEQLIALFDRHGYQDSVIFGHAKDGNIHFLLNERFDDPASLVRYRAFTDDMVDLVLAQDGTLKAEHGTGRIMAPFVRRQYGDELYDVMREVKLLLDPLGVLNPGILLNDDPASHLQNLKITPTVEEEVDRCVECGYCEPVCPSRDLTLTPRQRIVLRREMELAVQPSSCRFVVQPKPHQDARFPGPAWYCCRHSSYRRRRRHRRRSGRRRGTKRNPESATVLRARLDPLDFAFRAASPKPPGTSIASNCANSSVPESSRASESMYSMLTRV